MKKTYQDIAAELSLSVKTVYRVLNRAPNVRPETRDRVVAALNHYGFFDAARIGKEKVILEDPALSWSQRIAERLDRQLDPKIFETHSVALEDNEQTFLRAAEEAATIVLFSDPPEKTVRRIAEANPDAVIINIFGNAGGDITLGEDHYLGGKLAARALRDAGVHSAALVSYDHRAGHRNRADAFVMEFLRNHPEGSVRRCSLNRKNWMEVLRDGSSPEAVFITCGMLGARVYDDLISYGFRIPEDISVLIYDGPDEAAVENFPPVDAVEFSIPLVIDLAEYYIIKRPLLQHRGVFSTRVAPHIIKRGSVREKHTQRKG